MQLWVLFAFVLGASEARHYYPYSQYPSYSPHRQFTTSTTTPQPPYFRRSGLDVSGVNDKSSVQNYPQRYPQNYPSYSSHRHVSTTTVKPAYFKRSINDVMVVDEKTGIQYNPYSKHHPGRHVCTRQRNVTHPVRMKRVFCKPTYKKYMVRCGTQWCEGVRLVYEKFHKEVVADANHTTVDYTCCPGWTTVHWNTHGCNKPVCSPPCVNGGKCVKPNTCECPQGYNGNFCETKTSMYAPSTPPPQKTCTPLCKNGGICGSKQRCICASGYKGQHCETDIDECKQKPCDQICYNTPGSYKCECKEDFILQADGQTCRKENEEPLEVKDLEVKDLEVKMVNERKEQDRKLERIDRRLGKLEKTMKEQKKNEVSKSELQGIYTDIDKISQELNELNNKFKQMGTISDALIALRCKVDSNMAQVNNKLKTLDCVQLQVNNLGNNIDAVAKSSEDIDRITRTRYQECLQQCRQSQSQFKEPLSQCGEPTTEPIECPEDTFIEESILDECIEEETVTKMGSPHQNEIRNSHTSSHIIIPVSNSLSKSKTDKKSVSILNIASDPSYHAGSHMDTFNQHKRSSSHRSTTLDQPREGSGSCVDTRREQRNSTDPSATRVNSIVGSPGSRENTIRVHRSYTGPSATRVESIKEKPGSRVDTLSGHRRYTASSPTRDRSLHASTGSHIDSVCEQKSAKVPSGSCVESIKTSPDSRTDTLSKQKNGSSHKSTTHSASRDATDQQRDASCSQMSDTAQKTILSVQSESLISEESPPDLHSISGVMSHNKHLESEQFNNASGTHTQSFSQRRGGADLQ